MKPDAAIASTDMALDRLQWRAGKEAPAVSTMADARVLHVGPALSVKGGVSSVERLIIEELRREIDVRHVATACDGGMLAKANCFVRGMFRLWRELRVGRRTIVHIHFASWGSTWRKLVAASMAARAGAKVVLHAHGGAFEQFYAHQPRFIQERIATIFRRADLFFVLSTHWRTFYVARLGLDPERVKVLWNPTRMPAEVPDRAGRAQVHLVYLGLISELKGAFDLVRAVIGLPPEIRRRVKLTLAGNGELDRIREAVAPLGECAQVRSWINEPQRDELLRQADLYVLPSYREGVPMSILEAMAAGLPVVGTRVGGVPEIVQHEQTGLLVAAGDVEALRTQLARLIMDDDLRAAYGREARRSAERFDVTRYGRELIDHYRSISLQ